MCNVDKEVKGIRPKKDDKENGVRDSDGGKVEEEREKRSGVISCATEPHSRQAGNSS